MATKTKPSSSKRTGKASSIELVCPSCESLLELDRGFAGGVCRCSNCGTLMTVPADPASERAEKLVRPDRPDAPNRKQRPSRPDRPDAATPSRPAAPSRPERPETPARTARESAKPPRPAAPPPPPEAAIDEDDEEVYTTTSGRVVRVHASAIPTASKRKIARWTTYALFGGFILLLVVAVGLAAMVLLQPPPDARDLREGVIETFSYDADANPFTLDKPNALGLPLRKSTVVVVDTSAASEPWLQSVKDALAAGLGGHEGGSQVDLIYATMYGPVTLNRGLASVGGITRDAIASFQSQVTAKGEASLSKAVAMAMERSPSHVIIIAGSPPDDAAAIEVALSKNPELVVDALAVGRDVLELEDLARRFNGRYQLITDTRLSEWRDAAGTTTP